jgi:hypothetical protein
MPKTTHITLTLESRPGVLAKVARTLADAGVNITAFCAGEATGRGKIRLLVDDAARAREALRAAKYRPGEEPALIVTLPDRPGALAEVAERLARARINIRCAYATTTGGGQTSVVLTVADPDKAEAALGS